MTLGKFQPFPPPSRKVSFSFPRSLPLYLCYLCVSFLALSQVFERYLTFCGIGIQNAQLFEVSILEYKKNQVRYDTC